MGAMSKLESIISYVDQVALDAKGARFWHHVLLFVAYLYFSLRSLNLLWFTTTNPGILGSGVRGDSKYETLRKLKNAAGDEWADIIPTTIRITRRVDLGDLEEAMGGGGVWERTNSKALKFPVIAKPDLGAMGWKVHRIQCMEELERYAAEASADFLLQEYIDSEIEVGVFYYRMPNEKDGVVSSIARKEFSAVVGNGVNTLEALIASDRRVERVQKGFKDLGFYDNPDALKQVIPRGERVELGSPGNPFFWSKSYDERNWANEDLRMLLDLLSHRFEGGFYYGRYDIRLSIPAGQSIRSIDPSTIRILELNGAGSGVLHVWADGFSIRRIWKDTWVHWKMCWRIARYNRHRGVKPMSIREAWEIFQLLRNTKFQRGDW